MPKFKLVWDDLEENVKKSSNPAVAALKFSLSFEAKDEEHAQSIIESAMVDAEMRRLGKWHLEKIDG